LKVLKVRAGAETNSFASATLRSAVLLLIMICPTIRYGTIYGQIQTGATGPVIAMEQIIVSEKAGNLSFLHWLRMDEVGEENIPESGRRSNE
jgi:hypothetical protein